MFRFFLKKYAKCFGLILATSVVSLALGNIVTMLIGSGGGIVHLNTAFSAVKGVLCSGAIIFFLYHQHEVCANETSEPYFYKRIKQKKKIKAAYVFLGLIPIIAVGIVAIVFLIIKYPDFASAYEYRAYLLRTNKDITSEVDAQYYLAYFLCRSLPAMAVSSIFIWCAEMQWTAKRTCSKCGCYMSRVRTSTSDYCAGEDTEYKNVDTKYKVGDIYRKKDDKKVASVYSTRTEQRSRKVWASAWTEHSKCVYCGKEHEESKADAIVGDWK